MSNQALIFGAGKIGRGFLAHLLAAGDYKVTFVDASAQVVERLKTHGYQVHVLGAPEKDVTLRPAGAILARDETAVNAAVAGHDLMFTAAGGANLPAIGKLIAQGLNHRLKNVGGSDTPGEISGVNIIICENYKQPAAILRQAIHDHASTAVKSWMKDHLGIAETQVLRSCIEPTDAMKAIDPLAVQVQDWWVLPCDAEAIKGGPSIVQSIQNIKGIKLKPNFQNELIRKLYTYNCSNAVIGYLGQLKGHIMLAQGANDPQILAIARAAYDQTGEALIRAFGFDPVEQKELQELALSKYRDAQIADPIERNCRDSQRKISPTDRLMGPALLAHEHGVAPKAVCLAIAGALFYDLSDDPGTLKVRDVVKTQGPSAAITQFCGVAPDHALHKLILQSIPLLDDIADQKHKALIHQERANHA